MTSRNSIGTPPQTDFVNVDLIDVDPLYQRPLNEALVQAIVDDFRWEKFGSLTLARRPRGRFAVVEGQHRREAARRHPQVYGAPTVIFTFASIEDEAAAFVGINSDRRAVTLVEKHHALVTAGDPTALRINGLLEAADCGIGSSAPRETMAIAAVHRALNEYGYANTTKALKALRKAWPDVRRVLRANMILALAFLFHRNPSAQVEKVARALGAQTAAEMLAAANRIRLGGDTPAMAMRVAISNVYTVKYPTSGLYVRDKE